VVTVEWQPYSLEFINRTHGDDHYKHMMRASRPMFRLIALTRQDMGNDAVDLLYLALGTARHEHGRDLGHADTLRAVAIEAGVDPALVGRAGTDADLDVELTQSYAAYEGAGAFAVPTLFVAGQESPFFGPVIGSVPVGEDALALWHDVLGLSNRPDFFELKRSRS
jgi:2-hydroxychromene-2-carboxylate isomerase